MSVTILKETYEPGARLQITTRSLKPPFLTLQPTGELIGWFVSDSGRRYLQLWETVTDRKVRKIQIPESIIRDVDLIVRKKLKKANVSQPVRCSNGQNFASIQEASRMTGRPVSSIHAVLGGKRGHTGGLVFWYIDNR